MAIRTYCPKEQKAITLTLNVRVDAVGNPPCLGSEKDVEELYKSSNAEGLIAEEIKEHLMLELTRQVSVNSDIFDVFNITIE